MEQSPTTYKIGDVVKVVSLPSDELWASELINRVATVGWVNKHFTQSHLLDFGMEIELGRDSWGVVRHTHDNQEKLDGNYGWFVRPENIELVPKPKHRRNV